MHSNKTSLRYLFNLRAKFLRKFLRAMLNLNRIKEFLNLVIKFPERRLKENKF